MHNVAHMITPADIQTIRRALNLSQADLGLRVGGVHYTTVGRWETGKTRIPRTVWRALEDLKEEAERSSGRPETGEAA